MATALISALTRRPTYRDVAMTGEITLRGRVLPVGGIKEKVLAAHRAGIKTFIMPKRNKKDLDDVPHEIVEALRFVFVERMDEVLMVALHSDQSPPTDSETRATTTERRRQKKVSGVS
jgi:ATP-dependent Lon protease